MLGQSKTVYQAEIDAACELIDFWRFNAHYAQELYAEQPLSSPGVWNQLEYRPLEGFVYAVTPFNFTAIGAQPADRARAHGQHGRLEAGLDRDAVGLLRDEDPGGGGPAAGRHQLRAGRRRPPSRTRCSPTADLAGVHFTGSTGVFNSMWKTIGANMARYRSYPRIVGETGGKDFIVAHPSADPAALAVAIVRGGFEYQGQKCSAASRVYVPRSLWNEVRDRAVAMIARDQDGRRARLPELHGRRDRQEGVRQASREYLADAKKTREGHRRRQRERRARATSSSRR